MIGDLSAGAQNESAPALPACYPTVLTFKGSEEAFHPVVGSWQQGLTEAGVQATGKVFGPFPDVLFKLLVAVVSTGFKGDAIQV